MTRAELTRWKVEQATEALMTAERPYRAATLLMTRIGCSRRCAQNLLARARREIAEQHEGVMCELGEQLVYRYLRALRKAEEAGDQKAVCKLLDSVLRLTKEATESVGQMGPSKVVFTIRDPGQAKESSS